MENINIGTIYSEDELEKKFKETVIEHMEKIKDQCKIVKNEGKSIKSEIDIERYSKHQEKNISEEKKKEELDNKRKEKKKERIDQRKNQKKMKKSIKRKKNKKFN